MINKLLFAAALLSLALASGCATGGSGPGPAIVVKVNAPIVAAYVTQTVTFTATVTNTSNTAVTWSLSGTACTGSPNPCGSIDATTGVYKAPATAPNPNTVTIVATSQADNKTTGTDTIRVFQITVNITPSTPSVGLGFTQQFTAIVVPDDAPQTVAWSILNCSAGCGSIDATGLYSAVGATPGLGVTVQAAVPASLDPTGFASTNVLVVNSRLGNSGKPYAFRFSGFNSSGTPTAMAGSFLIANGTTITSGVEDVLTTSGGFAEYTTVTGTYTPNPPSNNEGTITLHASGAPGTTPNTFTAVLDASGDIQVIESDSNGTGSGVIEPTTPKFKDVTSLSGPFVFGFTGTDYLTGKRVGYAGFLPMDGNGNIGGTTPGLIDINDGGTASSANDVIGTYTMVNGAGTMTLTSSLLGKTYKFNLYGVSGQLSGTNPLTVYAISTDSIGANAAVSGTVVFQDTKGSPYNNATMKTTSVASLTGTDNSGANVSLTLLNFDGAGNLSGNFDQNDAGTILSVSSFGTGYTYSATGSGRYTLKLLGNPTAASPVAPLPFVLYSSGNGRGFVLDQSSASVITGTLTPQGKNPSFGFASSEMSGTFAAATTSSGASGVGPIAANLLLTFANPTQGVSGTEYVGTLGAQTIGGTYTLTTLAAGSGPPASAIALTVPSTQNYLIYAVDTSGCTGQDTSCTILDFFMIDVDKTNADPSLIFARQ